MGTLYYTRIEKKSGRERRELLARHRRVVESSVKKLLPWAKRLAAFKKIVEREELRLKPLLREIKAIKLKFVACCNEAELALKNEREARGKILVRGTSLELRGAEGEDFGEERDESRELTGVPRATKLERLVKYCPVWYLPAGDIKNFILELTELQDFLLRVAAIEKEIKRLQKRTSKRR